MAKGEATTAGLIGYLGKATKWGREIWAPAEQNGAIPVNIQDQHTNAFDLFFAQDVGSPTTLTADAAEHAYSISCTTGHGLIAGDGFVLRDPINQRGFTGEVVSIAGDNTVNIDRPLTFSFPATSTIVQERTTDLNVNGAVTRQTFSIGSPLTAELDITRFLIQMTTTDPALFDKFGDLTALTRGVQMRIVNDTSFNLWNAKTNADLANLMYDMTVYESAKSFQVNGLAGRMTYAGQNKHGVTLRIGGGEAIECIIQDNLSGLLSFKIIACGHIVTD